jgi:hypothetical protein
VAIDIVLVAATGTGHLGTGRTGNTTLVVALAVGPGSATHWQADSHGARAAASGTAYTAGSGDSSSGA